MKRIRLAFLHLALLSSPAWAGPDGDVAARLLGPGKQPVKGAAVVVRVKAWPGGKFRLTDHDARTDSKGRVSLVGVIPAGTRYGAWITAVEPGWVLVSKYHWSDGPDPMPAAELPTAPAHPMRVRFVGEAGRPLKGVAAYPSTRMTADGALHSVATGPRDAILLRSGGDGVVAMPYFLAGEWISVEVSFPGRDWGTRHFQVPTAKDALVDIPETAPATPDRDLQAGGDPSKRFFLTGPKGADPEPPGGYGLVLVLPGGDGAAGFRDWVRERYDVWVGAGWVWGQLVAPKWSGSQTITWPIAGSKVEGMKFTTEEFVAAVVEEASKHVRVDRRRVLAVGWSSSGPALYRIASLKETPVTGSLVAMSVFHPQEMESLAHVKGRPFFLLHSPTDDRCPLRLAEQARDTLRKNGAKVEWATYEGGHGWAGESEDQVRRGLRWLGQQVK